MKKLFFCLLCACLLAGSAYADVIWGPSRDEPAGEFFDTHDTEYVNRTYLCDSYDGTVTAYNTPEDLTVLETFENGQTLWVYYIWHGENLDWGLYSYEKGNQEYTGWVPMDELAVIYDETSFREEYAAEIIDYDGSYDDISSGYLWTYPHSGNLMEREPLELDPDYMETFPFQDTYVDTDGAVWCYLSYYMGSGYGWMCVTDPLNAEIPAVEVEQVRSASQENGGDSVSAPAESAEASPSESVEAETEPVSSGTSEPDTQSLELVVALVIAVVAVTAVLIVIFYKRKKR